VIAYKSGRLLTFFFWNVKRDFPICVLAADWSILANKGNNKITELRTILQMESQNS
jgi:hypothetical protein